MGLHVIGAAVLSTIKGMLNSLPIFATSSIEILLTWDLAKFQHNRLVSFHP